METRMADRYRTQDRTLNTRSHPDTIMQSRIMIVHVVVAGLPDFSQVMAPNTGKK